jgi:hypothetical protein
MTVDQPQESGSPLVPMWSRSAWTFLVGRLRFYSKPLPPTPDLLALPDPSGFAFIYNRWLFTVPRILSPPPLTCLPHHLHSQRHACYEGS